MSTYATSMSVKQQAILFDSHLILLACSVSHFALELFIKQGKMQSVIYILTDKLFTIRLISLTSFTASNVHLL